MKSGSLRACLILFFFVFPVTSPATVLIILERYQRVANAADALLLNAPQDDAVQTRKYVYS